jgi:hypothetical protein
MIIVRISGGLGNQMFQYAYGRALTLPTNDSLKLDTTSVQTGLRSFALDAFTVNIEHATMSRFKRKWLELKDRRKPASERTIIREVGFTFNENLRELRGEHYVIGLWQSEKYFASIRPQLLKDFTLHKLSSAAKTIRDTMQKTNSVSIHIRRGDYVSNQSTNQKHGTCSPEYYARAIAHIQKQVENPHFFVFSDDTAWVKEHITIPGNVTFVSDTHLKDAEELMLMSFCKHNIIANSSFSWWGAWLNQNAHKMVIAPKQWFLADIDTKDLLPTSWLQF